MADQPSGDQLDLFDEDQQIASVPLLSPADGQRLQEMRRLTPDERVQGLLNVGQLQEQLAGGGGIPYRPSRPCRWCGSADAELRKSGTQLPVLCRSCGRVSYNAPRVEVGLAERSVVTLREEIPPSQQARILDRDHGRCVLCSGREDLTIGHLLSVADGMAVGATREELYDDANLAAMCEACNSGLSRRSVSLLTFTIMRHLIQAERLRSSARR